VSFGEALRVAMQGVLANRLRAALTMLGITIGVGSVIVLVAVGHGSAVAVQSRIEGLGTNVVTVFSGGGGFARRGSGPASSFTQLTAKDVKALQDRDAAPDIKSVSPVVNATPTLTFGSATYSPGQFLGTTPSYAEARKESVAGGRFITSEDDSTHARVVVLGETVVQNLFGTTDPLGEQVKVNGIGFTVVGVLTPKGTNGLQDQDDLAIAPFTTTQDLLTGVNGGLSQIVVEARSSSTVDAAAQEAAAILTPTHSIDGTPTFRVLDQASLLQTTNATNHVFSVLLAAVAAISLLVGGIGVMNIMLVTIVERTREIGIRKAIGARRGDILGQFLVEAALIAILGGLAGILVGLIGSRFTIVGVQPAVEWSSVLLAFGVGVAVGLFFGIYPANRAASLRPIEALRHE
jgi:putative ABC transport system permease protein